MNNQLSIDNRNKAYHAIIDRLPAKRKQVFQLIKENPNCTAIDITYKCNLPINQIVGRITELKNSFLVTEEGRQTNTSSGMQNTIYKTINSIDQRINLINKQYVQLIDQKAELERDYILGVSKLTRTLINKEIKKIKNQISTLGKIIDEINI